MAGRDRPLPWVNSGVQKGLPSLLELSAKTVVQKQLGHLRDLPEGIPEDLLLLLLETTISQSRLDEHVLGLFRRSQSPRVNEHLDALNLKPLPPRVHTEPPPFLGDRRLP